MLALLGNFFLWLISLVTGKSAGTAEKLGKEETIAQNDQQALKLVQEDHEADNSYSGISNADLLLQTKRWKRPD